MPSLRSRKMEKRDIKKRMQSLRKDERRLSVGTEPSGLTRRRKGSSQGGARNTSRVGFGSGVGTMGGGGGIAGRETKE